MFSIKHRLSLLGLTVSIISMLSACTHPASNDITHPTIEHIATSSKVLAKSDCIPTSLTITADISDNIGIESATLWYRIGADREFSSAEMSHADQNRYTVTLIALDIPGGEYGVLEFYILARDQAGNETKSQMDRSVELLYCVGA